MKTYKGWEKSNLEMKDYLKPGDVINEELHSNIVCGYVPAYYCDENCAQAGEPEFESFGVFYRMTVTSFNNVYRYVGILPEFKTCK